MTPSVQTYLNYLYNMRGSIEMEIGTTKIKLISHTCFVLLLCATTGAQVHALLGTTVSQVVAAVHKQSALLARIVIIVLAALHRSVSTLWNFYRYHCYYFFAMVVASQSVNGTWRSCSAPMAAARLQVSSSMKLISLVTL
jgi:hypothetical protein